MAKLNSLFLPMCISGPRQVAFSLTAARAYLKLLGQKEQPGSSCVKVMKGNLKAHLDLELCGLAMPVELERGEKVSLLLLPVMQPSERGWKCSMEGTSLRAFLAIAKTELKSKRKKEDMKVS